MNKKMEYTLGVLLVIFILVLGLVIKKQMTQKGSETQEISTNTSNTTQTSSQTGGLGSEIYASEQSSVSDSLPDTNPFSSVKINPFE